MEYTPALRHITVRLFHCDPDILKDRRSLNIYARETAKELKLGNIKASFFLYNPLGITVVVLLDLCQLTVNSNPCDGYAQVDLFTPSPEAALSSAFN